MHQSKRLSPLQRRREEGRDMFIPGGLLHARPRGQFLPSIPRGTRVLKTSWQVAAAAEAFAAAQFARCGWDVSVQYGANQPGYDLMAVNGERMLKVSLKGSRAGGWGFHPVIS